LTTKLVSATSISLTTDANDVAVCFSMRSEPADPMVSPLSALEEHPSLLHARTSGTIETSERTKSERILWDMERPPLRLRRSRRDVVGATSVVAVVELLTPGARV
jgi:hypothetical protein